MPLKTTLAGEKFNALLSMIYERSPLQRKKLEKTLAKRDAAFFEEAEEFSRQYQQYLKSQNISLEFAIDAYLRLCADMMKCQIKFMKLGRYPVEFATEAFEKVYSQELTMKLYMVGLAMSQFLWETHYDMFTFFRDWMRANGGQVSSYLEIGPGHGLYLNKALEYLSQAKRVTAVDISTTSINITQSILECFRPSDRRVAYHNADMLKMDLRDRYDFITMGEVIEHVMIPDQLLKKLRDLLTEDGHAFISTCVDCPAIDHVYHFRSIEEIRSLVSDCGLRILDERVLPVEDLPIDEIIRRKITINYCALLERAST
jgi:SAM-dependent methyltransferase